MNSVSVYRKIAPLALVSVALLALSGCGESEEWGVDHAVEVEISHGPLDEKTGLYRCTLEDATLVEAGEKVRPLTEDTQMRVWHYQNSQEYVCTLKGQAVKSQSLKG